MSWEKYHFKASFEFPLGYDGRGKYILKGNCVCQLVQRSRDMHPAHCLLYKVSFLTLFLEAGNLKVWYQFALYCFVFLAEWHNNEVSWHWEWFIYTIGPKPLYTSLLTKWKWILKIMQLQENLVICLHTSSLINQVQPNHHHAQHTNVEKAIKISF